MEAQQQPTTLTAAVRNLYGETRTVWRTGKASVALPAAFLTIFTVLFAMMKRIFSRLFWFIYRRLNAWLPLPF
jgi:hypothetical protein